MKKVFLLSLILLAFNIQAMESVSIDFGDDTTKRLLDAVKDNKLETVLLDSGLEYRPLWNNLNLLLKYKHETRPQSLLHWAVEFKSVESARYLIKHGAIVDCATLHGRTPLMNAANNLSVEMVTLLLEKGANPNIKTTTDWTPLTFAVIKINLCQSEQEQKNLMQVIKLLLDNNAFIEKDEYRPTFVAPIAYAKDAEAIKLLNERLEQRKNDPQWQKKYPGSF